MFYLPNFSNSKASNQRKHYQVIGISELNFIFPLGKKVNFGRKCQVFLATPSKCNTKLIFETKCQLHGLEAMVSTQGGILVPVLGVSYAIDAATPFLKVKLPDINTA